MIDIVKIINQFLNFGKAFLIQRGILPGAIDNRWTPIPSNLLINRCSDTGGITFALPNNQTPLFFVHRVGIPQGAEGHIVIIGGSGSGKSSGIAAPTMESYKGPMVVTDIKGELSKIYSRLYAKGTATRPFIIFDPTDPKSPCFDPFIFLRSDDRRNLEANLEDIVKVILPDIPGSIDKYWRESAQSLLYSALRYYYCLGLSFIEAVIEISSTPTRELIKTLESKGDSNVLNGVQDFSLLKSEQLGSFGREMRNALRDLTNDDYICHAFSERENSFTWEDLEEKVIFLSIPTDKIDVLGKMITLMYKQLFRYLERRPEKYSQEGRNCEQILLLMDEFPRFGRIEGMDSAMATLRSKRVSICLMIQSLAQLDELYGKNGRRTILDNCSYKVILGANDPETQKALSDLAGTIPSLQWGASANLNRKLRITGYSVQLHGSEEPFIRPHELAFLKDVILLTPYGVYQVAKIPPIRQNYLIGDIYGLVNPTVSASEAEHIPEEVTIMTKEECKKQADEKLRAAETTQRKSQQTADKRRNFLIGAMFAKYFPSVKSLTPGSAAQNDEEFAELEAFFYLLSLKTELLEDLEIKAKHLVDTEPNGQWRNLPADEAALVIPGESTYTLADDSAQRR